MTGGTVDAEVARERAERLKERVYITFTALAVVIALRSHGASAEEAVATLLITVIGTLMAVFVADVVAHIAAHRTLPVRGQVHRMVRVSLGASTILILPLVFLALALAGVWQAERSLRAAMIALVASLVAIGYLAARRVRLPRWQRLVVLFGEFVLGIAVVGLELLAHGL